MKKILGAAVLAATVAGLAYEAQATTQNIILNATVNSFCRIAGSLTPADVTETIPVIYTTGAAVDTTATGRTFAVVCNRASDVSLTAVNGGLIGPAAASGFDHIINYTAAASGFVTIAAGSTATAATASAGANESLGTASRATPGAANITVTITPVANTNPLAEGSYTDTLRVVIVPQ